MKKTLTLFLTKDEMDVLSTLAKQKGLSKTAILRQALRLYQVVCLKQDTGKRIYFEDELNMKQTDIIII